MSYGTDDIQHIYPSIEQYYCIWTRSISITVQLSLTIYFTFKFIQKIKLNDIYTTYLITYVGITIITITSTTYNLKLIKTFFLIIAPINLFLLLTIITYRYVKSPITDENKPPTALYAAPTIVVAEYFSSSLELNMAFLIALYAFTSLLYQFALFKIVEYSITLP